MTFLVAVRLLLFEVINFLHHFLKVTTKFTLCSLHHKHHCYVYLLKYSFFLKMRLNLYEEQIEPNVIRHEQDLCLRLIFLLLPTIIVFCLFFIILLVIYLASLYVIAQFSLHINGFIAGTYGCMSNVCGSLTKKSFIMIGLCQSRSSAILWRSWLTYTQPGRPDLKRTGSSLAGKSLATSWPIELATKDPLALKTSRFLTPLNSFL